MTIVWTEYALHRLATRGFEAAKVEHIVRYSSERYFDAFTGRLVAVGRHDDTLVIIAYERYEDSITPVTIHGTTRVKINARIRAGRFVGE
jgi:hypothetical protein